MLSLIFFVCVPSGKEWKGLSIEERAPYVIQAKELRATHQRVGLTVVIILLVAPVFHEFAGTNTHRDIAPLTLCIFLYFAPSMLTYTCYFQLFFLQML